MIGRSLPDSTKRDSSLSIIDEEPQGQKKQTISGLCRHNAHVASRQGAEDVAKVWTVLSEICDKDVVQPEKPSLNETLRPWTHHPFGRPLVEKILHLYEEEVDVQSLASIVAVIGGSRREHPNTLNSSLNTANKPLRSPLHGHAATSSPDIVNEFAADNVPPRSLSYVNLEKVTSSVKTWSGIVHLIDERKKLTEYV